MGLLRHLFSSERWSSLHTPPRLEELKKEATPILAVDCFDGARFEFNKSFSPKFALNHNITMGSTAVPSGYEFGANFGDENVLLASRIDMAGRLNGRINAQVSDALTLRMQAQVSPEADAGASSCKLDADYRGSSFTASGSYMAGGLLSGTYLQSVSQSLALGAEGFYHVHKHVNGGAAAARCVWGHNGEHVATAKAGTFGNVELCYQRKVSEKVGLATELQYYHNQFCTFGVGYEFRLRNSTFRGLIASDTSCSAVLEERVSPGINLTLSGNLNHKKKEHKFGIGLQCGQ